MYIYVNYLFTHSEWCHPWWVCISTLKIDLTLHIYSVILAKEVHMNPSLPLAPPLFMHVSFRNFRHIFHQHGVSEIIRSCLNMILCVLRSMFYFSPRLILDEFLVYVTVEWFMVPYTNSLFG